MKVSEFLKLSFQRAPQQAFLCPCSCAPGMWGDTGCSQSWVERALLRCFSELYPHCQQGGSRRHLTASHVVLTACGLRVVSQSAASCICYHFMALRTSDHSFSLLSALTNSEAHACASSQGPSCECVLVIKLRAGD